MVFSGFLLKVRFHFFLSFSFGFRHKKINYEYSYKTYQYFINFYCTTTIFFVIFIWLYLPIKQIAANKKYNPEEFKTFFRFGVIKTTMNAQNQLKEKEIEAQSLVDSGGWISALKVHASGPNPVFKQS